MEPHLEHRDEQPYVEIPVEALLSEWGRVNALVGELMGWLEQRDETLSAVDTGANTENIMSERENETMIGRIWRGWTTIENADEYEKRVKEEILPKTIGEIAGCRDIQLFRRSLDNDEVEFTSILRFDSWDAVEQFAGEEYERVHLPPETRDLLVRYDEYPPHYELRLHLES